MGDAAGARSELGEAERLRRRGELEHEALVATSVGIQKVQEGDLAGALAQFTRATQVFEEYAPAHYQRGLVLQRLGRDADARASFDRAQRLNPSLVPPRNTKR
jgi:Flp pilus assembly protein TadD